MSKTKDIESIKALIAFLMEKKWKFVLLLSGLFIISCAYVFTKPNEWKVKTVILAESSNTSSIPGSLSGLVGLTGISPNATNTGEINIELYTELIKSTKFQSELIATEIQIDNSEITLEDYFNSKQKKNILSKMTSSIFGIFKSGSDAKKVVPTKGVKKYTQGEVAAMNKLYSGLSLDLNLELGVITVKGHYQDPHVAAHIVEYTVNYLKKYIIEYETKKESEQLKFLQKQLDEKSDNYLTSLNNLSEYMDNHRGIVKVKADAQLIKLQNENQIAFTLYNMLAGEYEEAKLKLEEQKSVFTEIQPITLPNAPSGIGSITMLIVIMISGMVLITVCYVFMFIIKTNFYAKN